MGIGKQGIISHKIFYVRFHQKIWYLVVRCNVASSKFNIKATEMSQEGNVVSLSDTLRSLKHLFTKLRDVKTTCVEFKVAASRVMTLIWQDNLISSIYFKHIIICSLFKYKFFHQFLFFMAEISTVKKAFVGYRLQ